MCFLYAEIREIHVFGLRLGDLVYCSESSNFIGWNFHGNEGIRGHLLLDSLCYVSIRNLLLYYTADQFQALVCLSPS